MSPVYATLIGYTDRRPAQYPAIDRAALMRDAHRIAQSFRPHFPSYRLALAYGLWAAWKSAKVRREFQSLNQQVGCLVGGYTAAQIKASRIATRRTGASLWAS